MPKSDQRFVSMVVDAALGVMFVHALKKTGLRESVLKMLFEKRSDPETPETPVEPTEGDRVQ